MARATTSRGASSAPGTSAMNRSPRSLMSFAPSPRTASLTSGAGQVAASSAVGWNCTNSMSARTAPARAGEREALAEAAERVRALGIEAADPAGRDHDLIRREESRP